MTDTNKGDRMFLLLFASLKLLVHLMVGKGYGYFRDEFYYLACSEHLAWGYVDQPPLSIGILWLGRNALGDSVIAIRLLAALAGAATVYLVGWMARELGGGRFAQAVAMLAAIIAPIYLGLNNFYSMNAFDLLLWAAAAAILIAILKRTRLELEGAAAEGGSLRLWILLGLVLGLGLLNKISVLWLGFGLFLGLLMTPARRFLMTRGPWVAGGISFLLFLPHVLWQIVHDWPTLEFMRNATGQKMKTVALLDFFSSQFLSMHPLNAPIWIAGLGFFLVLKDGRRFRLLGWIYLAVMLLLLVNRTSRPGYLSPAYSPLFAAGGVVFAGLIARLGWRWLKPAVVVVLVGGGLILAPFALPVLPVETYIRYAKFMGIGPSTDERKELRELPQHYADMFGWDELVETLAGVYDDLPPEDREVAAFFVYNYGEAGAIDLLGRERGLPKATSGHNNYWLWGPRGYSGEVLIIVGGSRDGHQRAFEEVEQAARTDCGPYCMPYEDDQPIFVCRGLRTPIEEAWPRLKHYD